VTLTQKLAAMSDRQLKHAYAIGDYWNVCEEAESRIRELEAALREKNEPHRSELIGDMHIWASDCRRCNWENRIDELLASTAETFADALPGGWELCETQPTGYSPNHRGRWVDGVLKCWDCQAETQANR
jgi:hypothetical protein